jgi:SAM-dependent methyltransferase
MVKPSSTTGEETRGARHWEAVYASRHEQECSWYQAEPRLSLQLIGHASLAAEDPIIDVGGGASVLVDRLLERGYMDVSVLDISAEAKRKSQKRLGDRSALVEWFNCDVGVFMPRRQYTLWHDRAMFHFMTSEPQRHRYVTTLKNALRPGGKAIIATFAIGGPSRCSGLEIMQCNAHRLLQELGGSFSLLDEQQENHLTPGGNEQLFNYFLLQKQK